MDNIITGREATGVVQQTMFNDDALYVVNHKPSETGDALRMFAACWAAAVFVDTYPMHDPSDPVRVKYEVQNAVNMRRKKALFGKYQTATSSPIVMYDAAMDADKYVRVQSPFDVVGFVPKWMVKIRKRGPVFDVLTRLGGLLTAANENTNIWTVNHDAWCKLFDAFGQVMFAEAVRAGVMSDFHAMLARDRIACHKKKDPAAMQRAAEVTSQVVAPAASSLPDWPGPYTRRQAEELSHALPADVGAVMRFLLGCAGRFSTTAKIACGVNRDPRDVGRTLTAMRALGMLGGAPGTSTWTLACQVVNSEEEK